MKLMHELKGRWAWEKDGMLSTRRIEFVPEKGGIRLNVYDGDEIFSLHSLKVNKETESDGSQSYFLGNYWARKDGAGFFSFESRFTESGEGGIFINASEFTFLDANTIAQSIMGYRFDREGEKWVPFRQEEKLKRVE